MSHFQRSRCPRLSDNDKSEACFHRSNHVKLRKTATPFTAVANTPAHDHNTFTETNKKRRPLSLQIFTTTHRNCLPNHKMTSSLFRPDDSAIPSEDHKHLDLVQNEFWLRAGLNSTRSPSMATSSSISSTAGYQYSPMCSVALRQSSKPCLAQTSAKAKRCAQQQTPRSSHWRTMASKA